jgi:hypothetical protein
VKQEKNPQMTEIAKALNALLTEGIETDLRRADYLDMPDQRPGLAQRFLEKIGVK